MSPKILLRCTICGKFHASYLVIDPNFGKGYLCYSCWKARQTAQPASPADRTAEPFSSTDDRQTPDEKQP
jgi:hypothetical protein